VKQLVLASGNPGKLRELSAILDELGYQLHAQSEFDVDEVAETGTTFVENAIIKARHAATMQRLPDYPRWPTIPVSKSMRSTGHRVYTAPDLPVPMPTMRPTTLYWSINCAMSRRQSAAHAIVRLSY
jgi:hypothetical protein